MSGDRFDHRPAPDFDYGAPRAALAVSVFADAAPAREQWRNEAIEVGFALASAGALALLRDPQPPAALGELMLIDFPQTTAAGLAELCEADRRAAQRACELVVATTPAALEDVFGCLALSNGAILVDPGPAERIVALGEAAVRASARRVRELGEQDRIALLRLSAQVAEIAQRLDRLGPGSQGFGSAPVAAPDRLADSGFAFSGPPPEDSGARLVDTARPALPDPRLVRRMIRQRQARARFFDSQLFADPAWDILLDLTAARAEQAKVAVTSLCIASGVPPTTALRWIAQMTEAGLLERVADDTDHRRAFIALSESAAESMARYFAQLGTKAGTPV